MSNVQIIQERVIMKNKYGSETTLDNRIDTESLDKDKSK